MKIRVWRMEAGVLISLAFAITPVRSQAHAQSQRTSARADANAPSRSLGPDRTTGFTLGVYTLAAPGVSVSGVDVDGTFATDFGQGAGLSADYGINRMFAVFASVDVAKQRTSDGTYPSGDFGLAHIEIGGRANFRTNDPNTIPYVSASIGRRALGASVWDNETGRQFDMGLSGYMLGVGGGVRHYITPSLALDGGAEIAYGSFNHLSQGGEEGDVLVNSTTSIRLKAGVSWRP
jgi:hypothetical protein